MQNSFVSTPMQTVISVAAFMCSIAKQAWNDRKSLNCFMQLSIFEKDQAGSSLSAL